VLDWYSTNLESGQGTIIDENNVKSSKKTWDVLQVSLAITLPHQSLAICDELSRNDVFIQTVVSNLHEHVTANEKFEQELHGALLLEFLQIIANLKTNLTIWRKCQTCGLKKGKTWKAFQMKLPSASWHSVWKRRRDRWGSAEFFKREIGYWIGGWFHRQIPPSEIYYNY